MKTILIVEDTPMNLDLLIQLLEDEFALISAGDGASGVAMAKAQHPDLILMDMSLPVMDGWDAVRAIKASPTLSTTPVIGLSAHAMASEREQALNCGCDAYLTKPVDETKLLAAIRGFIRE